MCLFGAVRYRDGGSMLVADGSDASIRQARSCDLLRHTGMRSDHLKARLPNDLDTFVR